MAANCHKRKATEPDIKNVKKVKVESEGHVSLHAVVNLRKVEGDKELSMSTKNLDEDLESVGITDDSLASVQGPPKRAAALRAQQNWLGQFLVCVE